MQLGLFLTRFALDCTVSNFIKHNRTNHSPSSHCHMQQMPPLTNILCSLSFAGITYGRKMFSAGSFQKNEYMKLPYLESDLRSDPCSCSLVRWCWFRHIFPSMRFFLNGGEIFYMHNKGKYLPKSGSYRGKLAQKSLSIGKELLEQKLGTSNLWPTLLKNLDFPLFFENCDCPSHIFENILISKKFLRYVSILGLTESPILWALSSSRMLLLILWVKTTDHWVSEAAPHSSSQRFFPSPQATKHLRTRKCFCPSHGSLRGAQLKALIEPSVLQHLPT